MLERFTWELRATLLGNHARNARDAGIHIRTSPGRPHAAPPNTAPRHAHAPRPRNAAPRARCPRCPQRLQCPPYKHSSPHAHYPLHTERAPASSHGDRGRGRGRLSRRARAYSLTPPAVRPETMYFCRYWKSRMTGMAARTAPAAKMPHGAVRSSAAHMYMPTASVNWL